MKENGTTGGIKFLKAGINAKASNYQSKISLSEFFFQKTFFGKHDALVTQPIHKTNNNYKTKIEDILQYLSTLNNCQGITDGAQ